MFKNFKFVLLVVLLIFVSGCSFNPLIKKSINMVDVDNMEQRLSKPVKQSLSQNNAQQGVNNQNLLHNSSGKIKKFTNYDELKSFLEETDLVEPYGSYGYGLPGIIKDMPRINIAKGVAADQEAVDTWGASSELGLGGTDKVDYSQTNVQVEGVDEADIIKTDGKYIYALSGADLFIISAYPANEAEILSKISFKSQPQDIYINDNYLVIFGYNYNIYNTEPYKHFIRKNDFTFFKVFDISDPKNPKQVRDLDFEGHYFNSRMIGDYVYFVTANYNYYYLEDEPIIPRILENDKVLPNKCEQGRCYTPEVYYFDIPYSSYNFISVNAINIKNNKEEVKGDVYLLSSGQEMYVSKNNIYLTYTRYISEYEIIQQAMQEIVYPMLSEKEKTKIKKIESVDNFILNKEEKLIKIGLIIERHMAKLPEDEQNKLEEKVKEAAKKIYREMSASLEKTIIHKIAINKGDLEYKAFGEVSGHLLNQFSMDEHNNFFRIATTRNRTWISFLDSQEQESYNNLYVLDKNLKVVGAVEKLAPGERIYSVRFMGDRAYMVTFKQMDPLFAIDLKDPYHPKILGKLKIPGYSNYLHPYNENILIGLGKDTKTSEWGGVRAAGLKLSLFDVSDINNPREIDTYIMGDAGSDSLALRDHKAFLFSREKNLLVIPVTIREIKENSDKYYGDLSFVGAAVFYVDENGFKLKGKISHTSFRKCEYFGDYYYNQVKRSLYIDNILYTFSNQLLKMNKIDDLELVSSLELKKESSNDFEIIK